MQLLPISDAIRRAEASIRTLNPFPHLPARQAKHFHATPDATFNHVADDANDRALFTHLLEAESTQEFAYGEPNRLGTQAGYLNAPHMVQKTLTPLVLPSPKEARYGNEPFVLPFPHLRKGDIAFHLRLEGAWDTICGGSFLRDSAGLPLAMVCRDWQESVDRTRKRVGKRTTGEVGRSLMMDEGAQV